MPAKCQVEKDYAVRKNQSIEIVHITDQWCRLRELSVNEEMKITLMVEYS